MSKSFREDLYYRLGEFVIKVPPLRERSEDIPFFVNKFILDAGTELNSRYGRFPRCTCPAGEPYLAG